MASKTQQKLLGKVVFFIALPAHGNLSYVARCGI
jgi:hypothetical protein